MFALALLMQTSNEAPREVEFHYVASQTSQSVSVVGQFNDWDRARMPLRFDPTKNEWSGRFPIAPGVYQYLLCEDGARWLPDPRAPKVSDGNGNTNSKLIVPPAFFDALPGARGDGHITTAAIQHRLGREDAVRRDKRTAAVWIRLRANDAEAVDLVSGPIAVPMERVEQDDLYEKWRGELPIAKGETTYQFAVKDGARRESIGPFHQDFANWPLPKVPDWVKDAVFYQIFPDRFANGDPANDGPDVKPWGTQPTPATWRIRLGGDLKGVREQLPYLQGLGITALYLNPVFAALSNHAYDTVDYLKVDPRFGTNQDLADLVKEGHQVGIRTMLDAVFNHSSPEFFAFRDLREKGEKSPYKDWFFPLAYPIRVEEGQRTYRTFAGVPTMPKLNQDNPATRDYFVNVGTHWIQEAKIDGWRLDVGDEVSHGFWRAFRKGVKRANPETYIVGEEWGDAHPWLQGDEHDSVMNYRWRKAVIDFLTGKATAPEFDRALRLIREDYPKETLLGMFNLLGSHDTERIKTVLGGDMDKVRQAVAFQLTYPGVPSIYYGDEIGMEGGKEPLSRGPFPREEEKRDHALWTLYATLIHLRKDRASLRRGDYRTLLADAKTGAFAFARRDKQEETRAYFAGSEPLRLPKQDYTGVCAEGMVVDDKDGIAIRPHGYLILWDHRDSSKER